MGIGIEGEASGLDRHVLLEKIQCIFCHFFMPQYFLLFQQGNCEKLGLFHLKIFFSEIISYSLSSFNIKSFFYNLETFL